MEFKFEAVYQLEDKKKIRESILASSIEAAKEKARTRMKKHKALGSYVEIDPDVLEEMRKQCPSK